MKKIFPILFVSATTLIAVVGVCGSFNSSFKKLRAEDHEYPVTFTSSDITNPSTSKNYYDSATFSFSKKTQSGLILALPLLLRVTEFQLNLAIIWWKLKMAVMMIQKFR